MIRPPLKHSTAQSLHEANLLELQNGLAEEDESIRQKRSDIAFTVRWHKNAKTDASNKSRRLVPKS